MDSIFQIIESINQVNRDTNNRNIIQGEIYQANPDGTYNVRVTVDGGVNINILNRLPENDISYIVQDTLDTTENLSIQVQLSCPNGDINRSTIKGLAQYNLPPTPTVRQFSTTTGGGCFLAGTLIKTISGEIEIEKIKPGIKVIGYNEKLGRICQCKVLKLLIHNKSTEMADKYYFLKTENSEARVTLNHPFFRDGEYRQIEQIEDYIYVQNGNSIAKEKIISKELIPCEKTVVYNLSLVLSSPCNYFANGLLVHNMESK